MKKQNLTEEMYRMRKLMNFDSKDYYENSTSYDKLFEEKLRTKRLLKEEINYENLPEWSKGGKKKWSNANYKDIIQYVEEYDKLLGGTFLTNKWYVLMMKWFKSNDTPQSRNSLKNWVFGDIYKGPNKPSTEATKKEKRKIKKGKINPKIFDSFSNILSKFLEVESVNTLVNSNTLKKINFLINTELPEFKNKGISFVNTESVTEFKNELICNLIILEWWSKNIKTHTDNPNWYDEKGEEELNNYIKSKSNFKTGFCESIMLEDVDSYFEGLTDSGQGIMYDLLDLDYSERGDDVGSGADIEVKVEPSKANGIKKTLMYDLGEKFSQEWSKKTGKKLDRKVLNRIGDITIGYEDTEIKTVSSTESGGSDFTIKQVGYSPMFQYPPLVSSEERTKLGMGFFPDNGINLSAKVMSELNSIIDDAKKEIGEYVKEINKSKEEYVKRQKEGDVIGEDILDEIVLEIGNFNLYAFSSTSKVRTNYKGKSKDSVGTYLSKKSFKDGKLVNPSWTFKVENAAKDMGGEPIEFTVLNGKYSTDKNAEQYEAFKNVTAGRTSEENNKPLAKDRYDVILNYLKDSIENRIIGVYGDSVNFVGEMVVKSTEENQVKPNRGPEWAKKVTDINAKDPRDGVPFYYELYKMAYSKNKNLRPVDFYMNRSKVDAENASKAAGTDITEDMLRGEYEKTYSVFRNSSAGFDFVLRMPEVTYKPKPDVDKFIVAKSEGLSIAIFTNKDLRVGEREDRKQNRKRKRGKRKWKWYPGKLLINWIINQPGGGGANIKMDGKCDAYG